MKDAPSRAYWLCQLTGWGLYTVVTLYQLLRGGMSLARSMTELTVAVATGLLLTHVARRRIRAQSWKILSAVRLAPRIVGASMSMAVVHVAVGAGLEMGLYGDRPRSATLVVVFAAMRWTMVYFIWLSFYVGYAVLEERRRSELQALLLEKELARAQLASLKAQLNPHFLFNSLNSLRALIAEDPEQARTAVTRLARSLRYALNAGGKDVVSLEEEMDIARDYLALEALRLGDRLTVESDLVGGSLEARIPTMLVQTLVENAVKHGIAELPRGGTLRIRARMTGGALEMEVENPRPREPPAVLEERSASVGLVNASARLRLLFGEEASLSLELQEERAVARVRVPQ